MYTYIKALGLHLGNSKCLINVGYIYYLFDVFPPSLDYNVRKSKDPGLYLKPQHSVSGMWEPSCHCMWKE